MCSEASLYSQCRPNFAFQTHYWRLDLIFLQNWFLDCHQNQHETSSGSSQLEATQHMAEECSTALPPDIRVSIGKCNCLYHNRNADVSEH